MSIPTLTNIDVRSKRVLMRVDYNVPIDDQGHIIDDTRIKASLPTLKHILDQGGRAILMSHLGRPKGIVESLRLKPVAERLAALQAEGHLDLRVDATVAAKAFDAMQSGVIAWWLEDPTRASRSVVHETLVRLHPALAARRSD